MSDSFKTILRKFTSAVLAFAIVLSTLYIPLSYQQLPEAQAQFGGPAFEVNPAVVGGVVATGASTVTSTLIMQVLNGLAWTVAKTAVQSITRSLVNWINSGFSGSPAFATDLNRSLRNLGDAVVEDFLGNLNEVVYDETGFNIRTPFQDQIAQRLREAYYRETSGLTYNQKYKCGVDFSSGNGGFRGFNSYIQETQVPQCNPFGAYQKATDELFRQVSSAQRTRKTELDWGKGFLSWRGKCLDQATNVDVGASLVAKGDAAEKLILAGGSAKLGSMEKCRNSEIKTPGSVVEDQLAHQLGSGVRQLELADSINEIVAALAGQLVNQVLGGVGLSGVSSPSSGGGRSYIDRATDSSSYNQSTGSLAQGFAQSVASSRRTVATYQTEWQTINTAANNAKQACSSNATAQAQAQQVIDDSSSALIKASVALSALDDFSARTAAVSGKTAASTITTITSEYQTFLSSSALPAPDELGRASIESQDTGTNTPVSLVTSMKKLARTCGGG
jgi:hypothetical protein